MKKIYLFLSAVLFGQAAVAQITDPAPYCASQAQFNYNMWDYIKVGGTTHSFGPMGQFGQFTTYKYYNTVAFPSVAAGGTVDIEVRAFSPNDGEPLYFGLFIDLNNNNTFEASENLMKNNNTINAALPVFGTHAPNDPTRQPRIITKNITIPAGTAAGVHRMRLVRAGVRAANGTFNYSNATDVGACIVVNEFNYGCVYDFNITVTNGLAVDDISGQKENSFQIYPNPVKDYLKISNPNKEEIKKVSIYSSLGQKVHEETVNSKDVISIEVAGLESGVYFAKIETSAAEYSNKFIKE